MSYPKRQRKAGLDSGPAALAAAARRRADGLQNVFDTLVGLMLFGLRAGPTLLLWTITAAIAWIAVKRGRRQSRA